MSGRLLCGDAVYHLRGLEAGSVHTCVTSPPYWGQRDYGVSGQLGLEADPQDYLATLVDVFREVRRVLRPDGTLWLNMADSYVGGGRGGIGTRSTINGGHASQNESRKALMSGPRLDPHPFGLANKQLLGLSWMLAMALQEDGWWLRSCNIWNKTSKLPESVKDRPTMSHEFVFLLAPSARYYYDAFAIREPYSDPVDAAAGRMRNKRSVWTLPTQPVTESHFACFPTWLVSPCILAGTSARGVCADCGTPFVRQTSMVDPDGVLGRGWHNHSDDARFGQRTHVEAGSAPIEIETGWRLRCECQARIWNEEECIKPATVLDPFSGLGTTMIVAEELGRDSIAIEISPRYCEMSIDRAKRFREKRQAQKAGGTVR